MRTKCDRCKNLVIKGIVKTCPYCPGKKVYGDLTAALLEWCPHFLLSEAEAARRAEREREQNAPINDEKQPYKNKKSKKQINKLYISGRITGKADFKKAFAAAEVSLKASGFVPVNPAEEHLPDGATWADYMRHDIKLLCDCDGIYMLAGWEKSQGAKIEHDLAAALKLKIYYESKQE